MAEMVSAAHVELGVRIRARRTKLKTSQEQLARDTGIHWTYIGRVERGQNNISLQKLLILAQALDIDPGDLVRGLKPAAKTRPEVTGDD